MKFIKINNDREVLTGLNSLVKHGYLTKVEFQHLIEKNCVTDEDLRVINNRVEVDQAPKSVCKLNHFRILQEIAKFIAIIN